jgi:pimeloyl-ACP methyl ester carboxylesterase
MLCKLATRAPQRAVRLLTKPVRAALALQVGDQSRATLAALFDTAMAAASLTTAVGFLPSLRSYDQYATLASIRAHATILSGGADVLTPPSHARDLVAAIPGATHVHLPMAGHMLPHEAPHAVTDAISNTIAAGIDSDPVTTAPVQRSGRPYTQPAMAA